MQEDFLHYIWQHKKFNTTHLKTTNNEAVNLVSVGQLNTNAGPDFFNARLNINGQLWAGNVEIHIKSSDWFLHNHEQDKAYDNVILHVVWEHDTEVFRHDNSAIPTLELKGVVETDVLNSYKQLFSKTATWINCENDFAQVDGFLMQNWLERLYFERLERKALEIGQLLKTSKNNWEAVLFKMLAKNFGLKVNGESFLSMANTVDFSIVRKLQNNQTHLEALFFGQCDLLNGDVEEPYYLNLREAYQYVMQKFNLSNQNTAPLQFFRLRPPNFPTIRLSQLASLYCKEHHLFSTINDINHIDGFYKLFSIQTSPFWESHYTFSKQSKPSKKPLTKAFIDLLLINTIVPIKFAYSQYKGKPIDGDIVSLIQQIASESNSIIKKFNSLKKVSVSALQSQGLLQLKNQYCIKNRCLQCAIGNSLLSK